MDGRGAVEFVLQTLKESLIFAAICAAIALVGVFVLGVPFFSGLGLVLLAVSAGLMLVGAGYNFVTPGNVKTVNALTNAKIDPKDDDYRRARHRAALYAVTGIFLFAYSLILALLMP